MLAVQGTWLLRNALAPTKLMADMNAHFTENRFHNKNHALRDQHNVGSEPRIVVLIPVYNDCELLPKTLSSLSHQTIRPTMILVGDNESTDNSAQAAASALAGHGLCYSVEAVRRTPGIGEMNINNVYWHLSQLVDSHQLSFDYLTTIEADVVLEPRYFEKLVDSCETDPNLGITR